MSARRLIKLIIILSIALPIAIGIYWFVPQVFERVRQLMIPFTQTSEYSMWETNGMKWYQDADRSFNLVMLGDKELSVDFTEKEAGALATQALLQDYSLAINGSYFIGSYVTSTPAGLLQIRGKRFTKFVSNIQVTHILAIDHETGDIDIFPGKNFDASTYTSSKYSLMQTGPLVVSNGVVQTESIDKSLNGNQASLRTLFGRTEQGVNFFVVTKLSFTLKEIAQELLNFAPLKGQKFDLLNLDGGGSTAMYSQDLQQFNWRETARLPIVIGVK